MKIENLTRITGGRLLNSPYVSAVEGIAFSVEKIERGNLFIDLDGDFTTHEIAVQKGAYGILTAKFPRILDTEIAWLHVNDMELTLIKLARFFASSRDVSFVLISKVQYELIKCLQLDFQNNLLSSSISGAIFDILHVKEKMLFFVTDNSFIEKIDPTFKSVEQSIIPEKLFSRGLFYSSYVFNGAFFPEIKLPSFLIPSLCAIQNFFEKELLSYKLDNFNNFTHFHPIFVNKTLEKRDFGTSEKVLIYENDKELFDKAIEHILKEAGSKNLSLLLPNELFKEYPNEVQKYVYKDKEDLVKLMNDFFHYVLVFDEFTAFETPTIMKPKQMSLF